MAGYPNPNALSAFAWPFGLSVAFCVVGLLPQIPLGTIPDTGTFIAACTVVLAIGATVGGVQAVRSLAANRKRRDHRNARALQDAANERAAQQDLVVRLNAALTETLPSQVVAHYAAAVDQLAQADARAATAAQLHQQRAFSPFWASIEAGYAALANHRAHVDAVSSLLTTYRDTRAQLAAADAKARLPDLPDSLRAAAHVPLGERIADDLHRLSFVAQHDFEFSMIYEQRRTTDAVIVGFASLQDAVTRMTSAITSSLRQLSTSIDAVHTQTQQLNANSVRAIDAAYSVNRSIQESTTLAHGFGSSHTLVGQVAQINNRLRDLDRSR